MAERAGVTCAARIRGVPPRGQRQTAGGKARPVFVQSGPRPGEVEAAISDASVMTFPAQTPSPPYFAVIFTSVRTPGDAGYAGTAERMVALAREQPGFLGYESVRENGAGISVSYWASLDAIAAWRRNVEHRDAQARAAGWYERFRVRVCRVERDS